MEKETLDGEPWTKKEEWESQFDEAWSDRGEEYPTRKSRVKTVVRQTLASQKEKMLGVIEGIKIPIAKDNPYFKMANALDGGNGLQALENGYRMALSDIKKKIEEL